MHALLSGGLPPPQGLGDCCHTALQALSRAHGGPWPLLSLPLFLSPTGAPSKCQHLFSIKRVIVSVRRRRSATGRLWTHEKEPPLLLCAIEPSSRWDGGGGSEASIASDKPPAEKPLMKPSWIYATISHLCTEAIMSLLKMAFASRLLNF